MSSITTEQGILHYEVYGRGRPIILLHGWLGSWGLWQKTMAELGKYYRTYALDFWGFGESGRREQSFAVEDFVEMVNEFMNHLGIIQAPVIGHSMGGTVSLLLAIKYPSRVQKVTVIGSPIDGESLALLLKLAGQRWIASLVFNSMWALRLGIRIYSPFVTKEPSWPEMMNRDLSKTTLESFLISIATLRETNLKPYLSQIRIPAMGMYGKKDVIVNPNQWQPMQTHIPNVRIERFDDAGHFIMLDQPTKFIETLKHFLKNEVG